MLPMLSPGSPARNKGREGWPLLEVEKDCKMMPNCQLRPVVNPGLDGRGGSPSSLFLFLLKISMENLEDYHGMQGGRGVGVTPTHRWIRR
jgi:hypothetical protein